MSKTYLCAIDYINNRWVKEGVWKGLESCLLQQKHTANVYKGAYIWTWCLTAKSWNSRWWPDSKTVLLPQPKLPWIQLIQFCQIMSCSSSVVQIIIQALKLTHSLSKVSVSALLLPEVDNNPHTKMQDIFLRNFSWFLNSVLGQTHPIPLQLQEGRLHNNF